MTLPPCTPVPCAPTLEQSYGVIFTTPEEYVQFGGIMLLIGLVLLAAAISRDGWVRLNPFWANEEPTEGQEEEAFGIYMSDPERHRLSPNVRYLAARAALRHAEEDRTTRWR